MGCPEASGHLTVVPPILAALTVFAAAAAGLLLAEDEGEEAPAELQAARAAAAAAAGSTSTIRRRGAVFSLKIDMMIFSFSVFSRSLARKAHMYALLMPGNAAMIMAGQMIGAATYGR
jgi:hypothetical protein